MEIQTLLWYIGVFFALVLIGWLTKTLFRMLRWFLIKLLRRKTTPSSD